MRCPRYTPCVVERDLLNVVIGSEDSTGIPIAQTVSPLAAFSTSYLKEKSQAYRASDPAPLVRNIHTFDHRGAMVR